MKRRSRRIEAISMINVSSMMDMFTILLIYLLYFFDPNTPVQSSIHLPSSSSMEPAATGMELRVELEGVEVNGRRVVALRNGEFYRGGDGAESVRIALAEAHAQDESQPMVIKCDKKIPFRVLSAILQAAAQAGFEEYRFVVLNEGN